MNAEILAIFMHLFSAALAGGIIGLERSFHGRPAGFRTHTLVSLASSLLMLVTLYQDQWLPVGLIGTVQTDPTRMAQGIMTGIGFLGAGVIFKEGFTVRGLTTAASVWVTAAIGILFGIGFYIPAVLATLFTIAVLSFFRIIEQRLPSYSYAHFFIRFDRDKVLSEEKLHTFLAEHGFSMANMSYRVSSNTNFFEYSMIISTNRAANFSKLSKKLLSMDNIYSFRISPTGD